MHGPVPAPGTRVIAFEQVRRASCGAMPATPAALAYGFRRHDAPSRTFGARRARCGADGPFYQSGVRAQRAATPARMDLPTLILIIVEQNSVV